MNSSQAQPTTSASAKAGNPFAAQTVGDSDGGAGLADVPSIGAAARVELREGYSKAGLGRSQFVVVVGEEGAGKSHLLAWLRKEQRPEARKDAKDAPAVVISMGPLPDLGQPFRHALRQVVGALCRKESPEAVPPLERPLDRLVWDVLLTQTCDLLDAGRVGMYQGPGALLKLVGPLCQDGAQKRSLLDYATAAEKVWSQVEPGLRSYLLSLPTEMSIDAAARAILLQYPYADRRSLVTAWLAGEDLAQKDRERLSAKQIINTEAAARYVLCSLVRLLGTQGPVVILYDQTEIVAEQHAQPGLHAMSELIAALQTQGGAPLQVLTCRPDTWAMFQDKPTRPGLTPTKHIDRVVKLEKPTPADLIKLATLRLQAATVPGEAKPRPLHPLRDEDVAAHKLGEVATPRAALAYFAARFDEALKSPAGAAKTDAAAKPAAATKTGKDGPSSVQVPPSGPQKSVTAAKTGKDGPSAVQVPPSGPIKPVAAPKTGKDGPSSVAAAPAKPAAKDAPSSPPKTANKDAPSSPHKPATAAKDAPSKPAAQAPRPTPPPEPAPVKEEPSAQSPSVTWMAMASDEGPLADAIALAKLELSPRSQAAQATRSSAPAKAASPAKPAAPAPPPEPAPVKEEPSAQSPSVTWMAMASDDSPLSDAISSYQADIASSKYSSVDMDPARGVRGTLPMMGASAAQKSKLAAPTPEEPPTKPQRSTQVRWPAVPGAGTGITSTKVMKVIGRRSTLEEGQLAEELGVSSETLTPVLSTLEKDGSIRMQPAGGGQRLIVKLTD